MKMRRGCDSLASTATPSTRRRLGHVDQLGTRPQGDRGRSPGAHGAGDGRTVTSWNSEFGFRSSEFGITAECRSAELLNPECRRPALGPAAVLRPSLAFQI